MRTIRILLTILSLYILVAPVPADITISGDSLRADTDAYTVLFNRGTVTQIHNKHTNETYTSPRTVDTIDRSVTIIKTNLDKNGDHYWGRWGSHLAIERVGPNEAQFVFSRGENALKLNIGIDPSNDDLIVRGDAVSETPGVMGMSWGIDHLIAYNLRLLIPAEKNQVIDVTSGIRYANFNYPSGRWEAQLAIVESPRGGFYVRGTDTTFQFKRLLYHSDATHFALDFITENQAPWDALTSANSVEWRFNTYAGNWQVPAGIYRDWMEAAFKPRRLSDMPAWVGNTGLFVIHTVLNIGMLADLAQEVDPTKTLLYLTEWRKYPKDVMYPDYTAVHHKFDAFLEEARRHGFRIMLHVSFYNCSPTHPLYEELKQDHIRQPNGKLSWWLRDEIDNPKRNAHIHLGNSQYRNLLVRQFKALRDKYAIDAFLLDVSHYIVNDANGLVEGLSSAAANVLIHNQLAEMMPEVALGGEGLHEVTFFPGKLRSTLSLRISYARYQLVFIRPLHPFRRL